MFGTASNLLVQAELARIDASVAYDRPHRFLLGLLRDARLRRPADDVAIVLEPTGQQITQSFPEPVQSIVDRLLLLGSLKMKEMVKPSGKLYVEGSPPATRYDRESLFGVWFTCRLQKNETPGPGPRFPRSCGRHRAE